MPAERLAMRHVRDVIRLKLAGMATREIARRVGAAPSTVRLTIHRLEAAGLTWPLPDDITDAVLEARLFASAGAGSGTRRGHRRQAEPDWAAVHRELKRKHVTLWEEYIASEPGGYRYSRFCELYRAWEGRLSVTMRQSHAAGDKLFIARHMWNGPAGKCFFRHFVLRERCGHMSGFSAVVDRWPR